MREAMPPSLQRVNGSRAIPPRSIATFVTAEALYWLVEVRVFMRLSVLYERVNQIWGEMPTVSRFTSGGSRLGVKLDDRCGLLASERNILVLPPPEIP